MVSPRHVDRLLFAAAFLVCGLAAHAQLYTDTQALHAPTTTASEYYGYYVAASGNLVAAGTTSNRRIHISERTASGWVHRATIAAGFPDNDPGAIALDGTTLVAGNEIFVRGLDGNWALQARLPPRIGNPALRGDLLAVGVASEGSPPDANEDGSVYIYQRSGSTWTQQARLMPDTTGMRELLGENVELEGDTVVAAGRAMPDGA